MFCFRVNTSVAHLWASRAVVGLCARVGRGEGVRRLGVGAWSSRVSEAVVARSSSFSAAHGRRRSLWQYWKKVRQAVGFPSWSQFHVTWSRFQSGNGTRTSPQLLLYGIAAFMWERERVSDQEVLSVLQQYEDRMKGRLGISRTLSSTPTSNPQPVLSCDSPPVPLDPSPRASTIHQQANREERFFREATAYYKAHTSKHLARLPLVGIRHDAWTTPYWLAYKVTGLASWFSVRHSKAPIVSQLPLVGLRPNPLPYAITDKLLELLHHFKHIVTGQVSRSRLAQLIANTFNSQLSNISLQQALCDQHSSFIANSTHQDYVLYLEAYRLNLYDRPNLLTLSKSSSMVAAFLKAVKKFGRVSEENGCHLVFDNVLGIDAVEVPSDQFITSGIHEERFDTHTSLEVLQDNHSDPGSYNGISRLAVLGVSFQPHPSPSHGNQQDGWVDLSKTLDSQLRVHTDTSGWVFTGAYCQQLTHLQLPKGALERSSSIEKERDALVDCIPSDGQGRGVEDTGQPVTLHGWELVAKQPMCTVYKKQYMDTGLFQYKVIGSYQDITAYDFYTVQVDNDARKLWDSYVAKLETVDYDPRTGSEVVHWVLKYPFPMSNREYVFVRRSWISDSEDTIVLVNRSVEHPQVPRGRKYVRVKSYFSEMVIKPHTFTDELGFDYELTYFDDPQSYLPSSCVNWVTTTAMPDFLGKIHSAALGRGHDPQKHMDGL